MNVRRTAAALFLSVLLFAGVAQAADFSVSGLFSISYNEEIWELDHHTYLDESTEDNRWLFLMYTDDILIDVNLTAATDYVVQTLVNANEETLRAYLKDMSFVGCRHLETLQVGDIPFAVFELTDKDGSYLLAETVVNGWCIEFYAYYDKSNTVDDELISALRSVVNGYQPWR